MIRVVHYLRRPGRGYYSMERLYEDTRAKMPSDIEASVCVSRFFSRGVFRRLYDIVRASRYQGDVNHVTGDVHFLTYLLRRRRTVLTIHDCVSLERAQGIKRWLLWTFWYWLPEKRCSVITVVSDATRQQLLRHLNCDADKIKVVHNHVSEEFEAAPRPFNSDRPRLLQIGTKKNKNLDRLIEALSGVNCELVIVGRLSEPQRSALSRHQVRYENLFELSREDLVEQYRLCDAVVFVSTYEGFGLPIVEANAVGRPVVTSDVWSMPEVAGDAACLVDPFDAASIRAGVLRIIEDTDYREDLVKAGFRNVKRFSTENISSQYAEVYRSLYAPRRRVGAPPARRANQ